MWLELENVAGMQRYITQVSTTTRKLLHLII